MNILSSLDNGRIYYRDDNSAALFSIEGQEFEVALHTEQGEALTFSNDPEVRKQEIIGIFAMLAGKNLLNDLPTHQQITITNRGIQEVDIADYAHEDHDEGRLDTTTEYQRFAKLFQQAVTPPKFPPSPVSSPPSSPPLSPMIIDPPSPPASPVLSKPPAPSPPQSYTPPPLWYPHPRYTPPPSPPPPAPIHIHLHKADKKEKAPKDQEPDYGLMPVPPDDPNYYPDNMDFGLMPIEAPPYDPTRDLLFLDDESDDDLVIFSDGPDGSSREAEIPKEPPIRELEPPSAFKTSIDKHFSTRDVLADGNCLFHASALGMGAPGPELRSAMFAFMREHPDEYRESLTVHLRSEASDYLKSNEEGRERWEGILPEAILDRFDELANIMHEEGKTESDRDRALETWLNGTALNDYAAAMAVGSSSCGEFEISLLSDHLKAPIFIYQKDAEPQKYGLKNSGEAVHLLYDPEHRHYQRLMPRGHSFITEHTHVRTLQKSKEPPVVEGIAPDFLKNLISKVDETATDIRSKSEDPYQTINSLSETTNTGALKAATGVVNALWMNDPNPPSAEMYSIVLAIASARLEDKIIHTYRWMIVEAIREAIRKNADLDLKHSQLIDAVMGDINVRFPTQFDNPTDDPIKDQQIRQLINDNVMTDIELNMGILAQMRQLQGSPLSAPPSAADPTPLPAPPPPSAPARPWWRPFW